MPGKLTESVPTPLVLGEVAAPLRLVSSFASRRLSSLANAGLDEATRLELFGNGVEEPTRAVLIRRFNMVPPGTGSEIFRALRTQHVSTFAR